VSGRVRDGKPFDRYVTNWRPDEVSELKSGENDAEYDTIDRKPTPVLCDGTIQWAEIPLLVLWDTGPCSDERSTAVEISRPDRPPKE
jgi:hypothetical protein